MDLPAKPKTQLSKRAAQPPAVRDKLAGSDSEKLIQAFFRNKSKNTVDAYQRDLRVFCEWLGVETVDEAAASLLSVGRGDANYLVLEFQQYMVDEKNYAPGTVNRRIAALRSMIKLANTLGICNYQLDVTNVSNDTYKDTRGPGHEGFLKMLGTLGDSNLDRRNYAILRMLYDMALRRFEVVGLDMKHVDLKRKTVMILGKRDKARRKVTIPESTAEALRDWIARRGSHPGALFESYDRAGRRADGRLTGRSVHKIVKKIGKNAGLDTWPHGLRHAAITRALDRLNGDVRRVQKFSRHKSVETLIRYDDNRRDEAGAIGNMLADEIDEGERGEGAES